MLLEAFNTVCEYVWMNWSVSDKGIFSFAVERLSSFKVMSFLYC